MILVGLRAQGLGLGLGALRIGRVVDWMEHVSDEQYQAANPAPPGVALIKGKDR
jgi:hypothetical protein